MGGGKSDMAKGKGGGGALAKEATKNVKGVTGYKVERPDGTTMEFFFQKRDGETYMKNDLGGIPSETPNGWTEQQMISRIKENGATVTRYSKSELVKRETARLEDRAKTNEFLNQSYARNKGADQGHKAYRNSKKASRINRRR